MRSPCTGVTADPPRALRLAIAAGGFDAGLQALRQRHGRRVAALHPGPWIAAPRAEGPTEAVANEQPTEVSDHTTGLRTGALEGAQGTRPSDAVAPALTGAGNDATGEPLVMAHPANVALKRKLAEVEPGTAPDARHDWDRDRLKYLKRESLVVDELAWPPPHPPFQPDHTVHGHPDAGPSGGGGAPICAAAQPQ